MKGKRKLIIIIAVVVVLLLGIGAGLFFFLMPEEEVLEAVSYTHLTLPTNREV